MTARRRSGGVGLGRRASPCLAGGPATVGVSSLRVPADVLDSSAAAGLRGDGRRGRRRARGRGRGRRLCLSGSAAAARRDKWAHKGTGQHDPGPSCRKGNATGQPCQPGQAAKATSWQEHDPRHQSFPGPAGPEQTTHHCRTAACQGKTPARPTDYRGGMAEIGCGALAVASPEWPPRRSALHAAAASASTAGRDA